MAAIEGASFRDPAGFIFQNDGVIYRQVNKAGKEDYDLLMSSGLYFELSGTGALVSHEEAGIDTAPDSAAAYKVIKPAKIPFISYPYEWSFSQLKEAALLTLFAHKKALEKGMALKDASAYNVQFIGNAPVIIDTLSFEKYREGEPWVAYGQFCRHFLAPLALMASTDIRLASLMKIYMDGIPLDLASKLLPFWTYLDPALLTNIHLHAKSQKHYEGRGIKTAEIKGRINKFGMLAIIDGLETAVRGLKWKPRGTEWADYYGDTNYPDGAFLEKKRITASFLEKTGLTSGLAWDLGANDGTFSALAAAGGLYTIAFDIDPAAVEKNFIKAGKKGAARLPLLCDLINPSPGIGWMHAERKSFLSRGPADLVLALALVHHLAISNNTPLAGIAEFFRACGKYLIVEFVPKEDSQAQRLLASRKNIFGSYDEVNFKREFSVYFDIITDEIIKGTSRTIYLMKGK